MAKKISSIATEKDKYQRIYIQVNPGKDPQKQGFSIKEAFYATKEISQLQNVKIEGIMMVPPYIEMDEKYRFIYRKTRELRDQILLSGVSSCQKLSMGMSRDFEIAIEEGATHIRIGTALFGARN